MYTGTRLTTAIHRRLLSRFFLREGGRLYTGYQYSCVYTILVLYISTIYILCYISCSLSYCLFHSSRGQVFTACADRLVRRKVLIHQSPVVLFERDIIRRLLNAISISYKLYDKRCFHIYPRFWKQFNVALLDCV